MKQQRRFTKDFEGEGVRLVRTSERSQREIAADLGIGLSTLVRWISRSRERQIDAPDRSGQRRSRCTSGASPRNSGRGSRARAVL